MNPPNVMGRRLAFAALALALTLANCFKPLVSDDPSYVQFARHVAAHPLDPYGFDFDGAMPANQVLAPPVVLYWLAGCIRLCGEQPFLWKLGLLPFCGLFVAVLHALGRRFARGLELPLTAMLVLSPTFLPSVNLMLDVPAQALGLSALVLFLRAADRGSWWLAVLAGLTCGLACETKYTAFVIPAVILAHGCLNGRVRMALLTVALTTGVFVAWESFTAARYGQSHFLTAIAARPGSHQFNRKAQLILPFFGLTGGVAPFLIPAGWLALRRSRRAVLGAMIAIPVAFGTIAGVPLLARLWTVPTPQFQSLVNAVAVGALGVLLWGTLGAVIARLCERPALPRSWLGPVSRSHLFLVAWLAFEVLGYFALSPFPAVRRVMGPVIVATLLVGRLASRTCRDRARAAQFRAAVAGAVVLGLTFFAIDLRDAHAQQELAERAVAWALGSAPASGVWVYAGCGLRFYAERSGARALSAPSCRPAVGDLVVQELDNDYCLSLVNGLPGHAVSAAVLHSRAGFPLHTENGYYGGRTPIEYLPGSMHGVRIFRVQPEAAAASRNAVAPGVTR